MNNWIKMADQKPTEQDGDFQGSIWILDRGDVKLKWYPEAIEDFELDPVYASHWLKTGFTKPLPPKDV